MPRSLIALFAGVLPRVEGFVTCLSNVLHIMDPVLLACEATLSMLLSMLSFYYLVCTIRF